MLQSTPHIYESQNGMFLPIFGVNYLEYILFFIVQRYLGHFNNHTGENEVEVVENGVGRHHFRGLFGLILAKTRPIWAQTGPFGPTRWSIVVLVEKKLLEMLKSTIGQNWAKKPLFVIISVIYFRGRLLWFLHLLLQFITDLDNSFCILFTIGWNNFLLLRILNFYPKTKWRTLNFEICKKKKLPTFRW